MATGQESFYFDAFEGTIFASCLLLSILIGVYYGFIKKGKDNVQDYLLGGKNMGIIPVSISLICSFVSANLFIGIPTEIYNYGTQISVNRLSIFVAAPVDAFCILPVFYKLQMTSPYEYLEMRFNKTARRLISIIYAFTTLLSIPLVIYVPSLILQQVTGWNLYWSAFILSAVCVFYTTMGGLKGVVWADTIQGVFMIVSMTVLVIVSTVRLGGVGEIFKVAEKGKRLEFFNMNIDPRIRLTFVSATLSHLFNEFSKAVDPPCIQRYTSLSTLRKAQWSVLIFAVGHSLFFYLSVYTGLILYTKYKDCDPILSKKIEKPDQIVPLYLLDFGADIRGLPGIFLAGTVCAALSTLSTNLNTVAGTVYKDLVEPSLREVNEKWASRILKLLVVTFGAVAFFLVMVVEKLGTITEIHVTLISIKEGPLVAIFLLGLFFPQANSFGTTAGAALSSVIMFWIIGQSHIARHSGQIIEERLPLSVEGCDFNLTAQISEILKPKYNNVSPIFEISMFYFMAMSNLLTILFGLILSYMSGANKAKEVNRNLLSPVIHRFVRTYSSVPLRDEGATSGDSSATNHLTTSL